jgi:hypothetical protein
MTIYDVPNINHCTVEEIGNPAVMYRITADEGWYIHYNNGVEDTALVYRTVVAFNARLDFSIIEIVSESELPEGAEICGGNTEPDHEVM